MPIDPACSAEYLRNRFDEAIWEKLGNLLHTLPEEQSTSMVDGLVERLIIECGAE